MYRYNEYYFITLNMHYKTAEKDEVQYSPFTSILYVPPRLRGAFWHKCQTQIRCLEVGNTDLIANSMAASWSVKIVTGAFPDMAFKKDENSHRKLSFVSSYNIADPKTQVCL